MQETKLTKIMNTLGKTIVGGLVATGAMTILMLMAPLMGMPEMNIGAMLAGMMGLPTAVGWVMHFMIGTVFALGYVYVVGNMLPIDRPFLRGMVFGILVFVGAQLMFFVMRSMGLMPAPTGSALMAMMGSLMGHLLYGGVLGAIAESNAPKHAHN